MPYIYENLSQFVLAYNAYLKTISQAALTDEPLPMDERTILLIFNCICSPYSGYLRSEISTALYTEHYTHIGTFSCQFPIMKSDDLFCY